MMKNKSNESRIDWTNNQTISNNTVVAIYRGRNLNEIPLNEENILEKSCHDSNIKNKVYKDVNSINSYEKHLTVLSLIMIKQ